MVGDPTTIADISMAGYMYFDRGIDLVASPSTFWGWTRSSRRSPEPERAERSRCIGRTWSNVRRDTKFVDLTPQHLDFFPARVGVASDGHVPNVGDDDQPASFTASGRGGLHYGRQSSRQRPNDAASSSRAPSIEIDKRRPRSTLWSEPHHSHQMAQPYDNRRCFYRLTGG